MHYIPCAICDEYAAKNALANGAQITRRFHWRFATQAPGVINPPGRPRDGSGQNRGVAHAPAASVTPAKWVSCAAQNAALVVPPLPLTLQVVGEERLAREALADTGRSTIGFD